MQFTEKDIKRFYNKVQKTEKCWIWKPAKDADYGNFFLSGKLRKAHRVSLIFEKIEIPNEMYVDHICRNRSCVKPGHLRVVTPKQNSTENCGDNAHKLNAKKTHCKFGHEFSDKNTSKRHGTRYCKRCHSLRGSVEFRRLTMKMNEILRRP